MILVEIRFNLLRVGLIYLELLRVTKAAYTLIIKKLEKVFHIVDKLLN